MKYNQLGKTGLKISNIGFGAMNLGNLGKDKAYKILDKVYDLGINFIDTANVYGNSEKILGEWLKDNDCRTEFIISSKVGWPMGEKPNEQGLSRVHITKQLELSLKKLQTDYIDIYQPHYYDGKVDLNNLAHLFDEFIISNRITCIGGPLFTKPYYLIKWYHLAKEQGLNSIGTKLMTTSLLSRGMYDGNTREIAVDHNIGLITFGSLGGGLLTGKYHSKKPFPDNGKEMFRDIVQEGKIDGLIDKLQEISEEQEISVAELSLAWVLSHDFMDCVIVGASSPDQLQSSFEIQEISLSQEIFSELTQLSDIYKLW